MKVRWFSKFIQFIKNEYQKTVDGFIAYVNNRNNHDKGLMA